MKKTIKTLAIFMAILMLTLSVSVAAAANEAAASPVLTVEAVTFGSYVIAPKTVVLFASIEPELQSDELDALQCEWEIQDAEGNAVDTSDFLMFNFEDAPIMFLTGLPVGDYTAVCSVVLGEETLRASADFTIDPHLDGTAFSEMVATVFGNGFAPWISIRYTPESWAAYNDAMDALDELLFAEELPTQEDFDAAVAALLEAFNNLTPKGGVMEYFWQVFDWVVESSMMLFGWALASVFILFDIGMSAVDTVSGWFR